MAVCRLGSAQALPDPSPAAQASPSDVWVCAYYLNDNQAKDGRLPADQIDFHAISHIIHVGMYANGDGTVGPKGAVPLADCLNVIHKAHDAGCKALAIMGSDEGIDNLRHALTDPVRPMLVRNLVQYIIIRGYDGIDLDMEPLEDIDVPNYTKFVRELRAELNYYNPKLLLTAAVASEPAMFGQLQDQFDRIDLMTYDLAGPWPGFKSWYNASLYDGGSDKLNPKEPYPSADGMAQAFMKAGVPAAKLGIGIAFYGYTWSGVSGPKQDITGLTNADVNDSSEYYDIMDKDFQPSRYHWDDGAKSAYLSIDSPDKKQRRFISYDDETACAAKIDYVRKNHLGGVIIWELSGGYRPNQPEGQRDPLLQAVKKAWLLR